MYKVVDLIVKISFIFKFQSFFFLPLCLCRMQKELKKKKDLCFSLHDF